MPLGLAEGTVALADHDPRWALAYQQEERLIAGALGPLAAEMRHCGSTAIAGIQAKPILDIILGLQAGTDPLDCVKPLQAVGYKYSEIEVVPGEHFFSKGSPIAYHLHVVPWRGRIWGEKLLFCERLTNDPGLRAAYQGLKTKLAAQYAADRAAYTAGKSAFVASVLAGRDPPA